MLKKQKGNFTLLIKLRAEWKYMKEDRPVETCLRVQSIFKKNIFMNDISNYS